MIKKYFYDKWKDAIRANDFNLAKAYAKIFDGIKVNGVGI